MSGAPVAILDYEVDKVDISWKGSVRRRVCISVSCEATLQSPELPVCPLFIERWYALSVITERNPDTFRVERRF